MQNKFIVFACAPIIFCGCASVFQTSAKIAEIGCVYYFAPPGNAVVAYSRDSKIFLKCPLAAFKKQYSYAQGVVLTSCFGGFRYAELEADVKHLPVVNKAEYVFVVTDIDVIAHEKSVFDGMGIFSLCKGLSEQDFEAEEKIPVPENLRSLPHFFPCIGGTPAQMCPTMPFVREEKSSLHYILLPVAVLEGILVDFPVSVIMTLTGTIWYIPFGNIF